MKIKIQGLTTHYKQIGKGSPVVILHGWGGSLNSWEKVMEILSKKHMVVCLDLPGFGKSDDPKEPWDINNYISFILDFLKALKIDEFVLLGHSFGGGLGTKITAKNPRIVKKLILCDAAVVRAKKRLTLRQKVVKTFAKIFKPLNKNRFIQSKVTPFAYKLAGTSDYFSANDIMKETFKKISKEDLRAFTTYIKKPTLIIWGSEDKITPLEDAYTLKNMIDHAKLIIIEKTKHSPHLKKPEEVSQAILEFIKKEL